jgi:MATE family multidrug resistance protein
MLVGALRGAGDTRFILLNTGIISMIAVGVGHSLQAYFHWRQTDYALFGWWWVMTAWLFVLGITYLIRFQQGQWKRMRVIEPELEETEGKAEVAAEPCEVG